MVTGLLLTTSEQSEGMTGESTLLTDRQKKPARAGQWRVGSEVGRSVKGWVHDAKTKMSQVVSEECRSSDPHRQRINCVR